MNGTIFDLAEERVLHLASLLTAGGGERDDLIEVFARAAWTTLAEPGDGTAGLLVSTLGATRALTTLIGRTPVAEVVELLGASGDTSTADRAAKRLAEGFARWLPRLESQVVIRSIDLAAQRSIGLVTPADNAWPAGVDDLGVHAPLALWVRGSREALTEAPSIALVGARAATGYGESTTLESASALAERGFTVISGAAYGIDAAAHRGTLGSNGRTIAFLAGGVDRPYPSGHAELIDAIAKHGAVVSEIPSGGAPTKWRFLQRNRLIAASAQATVVVEAGWRSGSLNTAGHAAALGRPLGAVPGRVDSATSSGCHRLIREYNAVCVTNAAEMAELVVPEGAGADTSSAGSPEELRVIDALSTRSPREPDDLAARSGLGRESVEAVLGILELEGRVVRRDRGWVFSSSGSQASTR